VLFVETCKLQGSAQQWVTGIPVEICKHNVMQLFGAVQTEMKWWQCILASCLGSVGCIAGSIAIVWQL